MPFDFAAIFESSPNPYVLLDRDMTIVGMNSAYLAATMRSQDAIMGRNMFDAFPSNPESDSHKLLHDSLSRVITEGERDDIALIRYDIVQPDGEMAERFWSATHTPILGDGGDTKFVLQHTVDVTELHELRQLRDGMGLVKRAGAVQSRYEGLEAQMKRLNRLFEQAPGFVAWLEGSEHTFRLANAAYRKLVGRDDLIGRTVADALPGIASEGFVTLLDQVMQSGEAYIGKNQRVGLGHGNQLEWSVIDFIYQPILDSDGSSIGVFVLGHDVSEGAAALERQAELIDELNHRVKNTLSIVQSLASQSFRGSATHEPQLLSFDRRLRSLASAHDQLTRSSWQTATIRSILETSMDAAIGGLDARTQIHGPDALISPQTAVTFAMVINELCTNAVKYGALSSPSGTVRVSWRVADGEAVVDWVERGGPPVARPSRKGFGTRFIERGLATRSSAKVLLDFDPQGLHASFAVPLVDISEG